MNNKELQRSRVQLFRDAANFRPVERIPYLSSAVTWKVFDAGHTLDEALTDFGVMESCVRHFLDTYPVDAMLDIGIRNQFGVTEAFGSPGYYYYTPETVGIHDHAHCTVDTLGEYLENPEKYIWETVLPKKYGEDWEKKTKSDWKRTFKAYMDYTKFVLHMASVTGKEYGLPSMAPNNPMKGAIQFGIEELEANLLGITQLSIAMRRNADVIGDFVEKWDAQHIDPIIEKVKAGKGPDYKYCFDASIMMLAQNILNPRQFERFYWPGLKRLLDAYAEKGMNVRIFAEGSIARVCDHFADYPKGTITLHLEQDDPFMIREKLPNVAIMGGMTTDLLAGGTADECVAYAKRLCDELGQGFIFSENKMLSYRNDAKPENLMAVCRFVRDYRKEN